MRIAQVSPLHESVPPKLYGGTERVVSYLTEELVRRGHDVTLFASGDSITNATLVSVLPKALIETKIRPVYSINTPLLHILARAYITMQGQFDVIHDHNSFSGIPFAQISRTPVINTMHGSVPV